MTQGGTLNPRTRDERLLAALAHTLVVANWVGLGGAVILWALNREEKGYVSFQAAQAAVYQLLTMLATIVCWVCWFGFYMLSLTPLMVAPTEFPGGAGIFWLGLASMFIPVAIMAVLVLYGLWGAVRCFQGRSFRYVLIGPWLERYMFSDEE